MIDVVDPLQRFNRGRDPERLAMKLEIFGSYKGDNPLSYFDLHDFDEATLPPSPEIWCASWPWC